MSELDLGSFANSAEAVLALRQVLAQEPHSTGLRKGLVALLIKLDRFSEALDHGNPLLERGELDEESRYFMAWARAGNGDGIGALELIRDHPKEVAWCLELGTLVSRVPQWEVSLTFFQRVLALEPNHGDARNNAITALQQLGSRDEAEVAAKESLLHFRDHPKERMRFAFLLAEILLLKGDFETGLELFESRFAMDAFKPPAALPIPVWTGEPLEGRTLLVRWEQGFGDVFMCARFATVLSRMGAEVLVEVAPGADSVLATCEGVTRTVFGDISVPGNTCQVPIASLLRILGVRASSIPASVPYLHVPKAVKSRAAIDERLSQIGPGLRLGLVWSGNPKHFRDRERSVPPGMLDLLSGIPGISWVSLQKGAVAKPGFLTADLDPCLEDFGDTAYALSRLDGLVSVDTSVAHLAGAMGVPTWLLLTYLPDWRWMRQRRDTPWYPNTELWRQACPGDWPSLFQAVRSRLAERGFEVKV